MKGLWSTPAEIWEKGERSASLMAWLIDGEPLRKNRFEEFSSKEEPKVQNPDQLADNDELSIEKDI